MVQDKSQDYQLIVGYEYQDTTVIRFKRKVNTCDGEDLALTVSLGYLMGTVGLFEPLTSARSPHFDYEHKPLTLSF